MDLLPPVREERVVVAAAAMELLPPVREERLEAASSSTAVAVSAAVVVRRRKPRALVGVARAVPGYSWA